MKKILFALLSVGILFASCDKDDNNNGGGGSGKTDPSTIAKSNLVAYFAFNGDGNDAVASLAPVEKPNVKFAKGRRGQALQGADNAYFLYNLPATSPIRTLKGFAMAMWFKNPQIPSSQAPVPMIFQVTNDDDLFWGNLSLTMDRHDSADTLNMKTTFRKDGASWANQFVGFPTSAYTPDRWFHVVYQYDNVTSAYNVYVNGAKITTDENVINRKSGDGEGPLGDLNFVKASNIIIGGWMPKVKNGATDEWMGWFNGMLDEFRIYDRALTDAEVSALYAAEVANMD